MKFHIKLHEYFLKSNIKRREYGSLCIKTTQKEYQLYERKENVQLVF